VPGPHHPHSKEISPYVYSKSTLFQCKAITPCPITTRPCKKSLSSVLAGPPQVLYGCYKISSEPSLLQAEQPQLFQPFLIGEIFQPSDLSGLPLDLLQQVHVFPVLRALQLEAGLQVRSHQNRAEGQNPLP